MGVLNLTPDSFSDGGRYCAPELALARARELLAEGAVVIDVGGESTRPGAEPVTESEELDRVIPIIEKICVEFDCIVSVDTMKPAVMHAACAAGAEIINDVFALRAPGACEVVRATGAAAIVMHMQGEPRSMQQQPHYAEVLGEVEAFLLDRVAQCVGAGIPRECLLIDPGFGFGKSLDHNLALFAGLPRLAAHGLPLVVGVSRKSMFGQLLQRPVHERVDGGTAAAALAVDAGAAIIRTHDVRAAYDALRFASAVRTARRTIPINGVQPSAAHPQKFQELTA